MLITLLLVLIFSSLLKQAPFFKSAEIPWFYLFILLIIKSFVGYLSFAYHQYYFAGGDGAIYLSGGKDLIRFSGHDPWVYIQLFFNMNRGIPEWESVYHQIIYWDSNSGLNVINDNRNAIRINSIISFFSFNHIIAHLLILNFLTVIGLTALYRSFKNKLTSIPPAMLFVAIYLSPSILFWTSGILKESHSIFFLGLYVFFFVRFLDKYNWKDGLLLLLFAILLLFARTYLAGILFAVSAFVFIVRLFKITKIQFRLGILVLGFVLSIFTFYRFHIDLFQIIQAKQQAFNLIGRSANSYFEISELKKPIDLFLYLPQALLNVFIQPQLFSFKSFLFVFPLIENIDILFFCALALYFRKMPPKESWLILLALFLVYFLSSWLIGISIPVQGAISRYKAISQLFLLLFIFSFIDWKRLQKSYFSE